jgi:hypothetical protein
MDFDLDGDDEEAFEGPDAYIEEDEELQEQVEEGEANLRGLRSMVQSGSSVMFSLARIS